MPHFSPISISKNVNLVYTILKSKPFLMVSLLFFDSEQFLIYKQTQENASKYPKLACAKITILHPADLKTKTLWIQVSYRYLRTS